MANKKKEKSCKNGSDFVWYVPYKLIIFPNFLLLFNFYLTN